MLLTPFTGVLADRRDRHRILIVTQVLSLVQSLALAVLALTGLITVIDILVLLRDSVRPIYQSRGIITVATVPDVDSGALG